MGAGYYTLRDCHYFKDDTAELVLRDYDCLYRYNRFGYDIALYNVPRQNALGYYADRKYDDNSIVADTLQEFHRYREGIYRFEGYFLIEAKDTNALKKKALGIKSGDFYIFIAAQNIDHYYYHCMYVNDDWYCGGYYNGFTKGSTRLP